MKKITVFLDNASIEMNKENVETLRQAIAEYDESNVPEPFQVGFNQHGCVFEGHDGFTNNWIGLRSEDGKRAEIWIKDQQDNCHIMQSFTWHRGGYKLKDLRDLFTSMAKYVADKMEDE